MSSLIQGYEYDIFISYRQKDNKYDSWLTEFEEHLIPGREYAFKNMVWRDIIWGQPDENLV